MMMYKKLDSRIKFILFYVFLFIIIFVCNLATRIHVDETWSYGFSHNIYSGLLPYVDFNMVITPIHPFLMSIPFHIFGSNIFIYELEHAFIMILIFYLITKIIDGDHAYVIMAFVFLPLLFFANYNTFLFFLFCLIVYLEKNNSNDYLIGFVLGIIFLTKQSIGFMLLLPSFYYLLKLKKIGKRLIGFMIPNIIFLIYLICTDSLFSFLDLCFFGLFDFATRNVGFSRSSFGLSIIISIITLFFVLRNRHNLVGYYSLTFLIGMVVPIFDYWHLYYGFCGVLLFLSSLTKKRYVNGRVFFFGIVFIYSIVNFNNIMSLFDVDNQLNHFRYKNLGLSEIQIDEVRTVNEFIQKHRDNIVILSKDAYLLKLCNDIQIESTDLLNTGNFGYDGTNKLINILKKKEDTYFLVDRNIIGHMDRKAINYVVKNAKKVEDLTIFEVYYK